MPFPIRSKATQQAIIDGVDASLSSIRHLAAEVKAALRRAARLRQAILARAFEGKLVPQDPNDEPAYILLERLRTSRAQTPPARRSPRKGAREVHA